MIRLDRIQSDFSVALSRLGLEHVRPLPVVNPTIRKPENYIDAFPPDLRKHAVWVFAPIMDHLGYEFPEGWPAASFPRANRALFEMVRRLKGVYNRQLW